MMQSSLLFLESKDSRVEPRQTKEMARFLGQTYNKP